MHVKRTCFLMDYSPSRWENIGPDVSSKVIFCYQVCVVVSNFKLDLPLGEALHIHLKQNQDQSWKFNIICHGSYLQTHKSLHVHVHVHDCQFNSLFFNKYSPTFQCLQQLHFWMFLYSQHYYRAGSTHISCTD